MRRSGRRKFCLLLLMESELDILKEKYYCVCKVNFPYGGYLM